MTTTASWTTRTGEDKHVTVIGYHALEKLICQVHAEGGIFTRIAAVQSSKKK